jgi:hypothetical protein
MKELWQSQVTSSYSLAFKLNQPFWLFAEFLLAANLLNLSMRIPRAFELAEVISSFKPFRFLFDLGWSIV